MNNKLFKIQEMLFEEMEIIKNLDTEKGLFKREIERSDALTKNAVSFIKSVNTNKKINPKRMF